MHACWNWGLNFKNSTKTFMHGACNRAYVSDDPDWFSRHPHTGLYINLICWTNGFYCIHNSSVLFIWFSLLLLCAAAHSWCFWFLFFFLFIKWHVSWINKYENDSNIHSVCKMNANAMLDSLSIVLRCCVY